MAGGRVWWQVAICGDATLRVGKLDTIQEFNRGS